MDYKKSVEELKNNRFDWFKPEIGEHKIEVLEEPEEITKTFDEEVKQQIRLKIKEGGRNFSWDINKGLTLSSIFGQFMVVGKNFGQLKGMKLTLLVTNDGKKNSYLIKEALDLMKAENVKEEQI